MIDAEKNNLNTEIPVPDKLIPLLKEYTKTVIRQQPNDLLIWSEQYFRNLVKNQKITKIAKPKSDSNPE